MTNKLVLGIDPGIASAGWAVVKRLPDRYALLDSGLITTPSKTALGERLKTHYTEIQSILEKHRPDLVSIEAVFHNRNISSSISTGQVIGLVELVCAVSGVPTLQVNPQFVKSAVIGVGTASKDVMIRSVNRLLGMKVKSPHVADAVACAVAGHLKMPIPMELKV